MQRRNAKGSIIGAIGSPFMDTNETVVFYLALAGLVLIATTSLWA